jgi:bifunctional ADP-heptose synthase (sugar kinase/adenylyltransferase)/phosphoglycolate phosphatase-like HAD superfamily hydrolase
MQIAKLKEILKVIPRSRIGIIGDFCLDVYWHINNAKSEKSVETNLPTRPVEVQEYSLGGAGNIANNIYAMGINNIQVFGVVGVDPFSYHMKTLMVERKIDCDGLFSQKENWSTHVYVKPIVDGKEENRIDFGNYNILTEETVFKLIGSLRNKILELDVVIINQQVITGIHNSVLFRKELQKVINEYENTIFILDSRQMGNEYRNVVQKINSYEAVSLCGMDYKPDDFIPLDVTRDAMKKLYSKWDNPIFVTRGSRGCLIISKNGIFDVPGLHITGKLDTVGAGDSMLAGITSCLASGYSTQQAAVFGNLVAGVTIQKLCITGTASPSEILNIAKNVDYVYNVDKADDIRLAEYYENTEIEVISEVPSDIKITHAIFDHDGTISTLREGWEDIMRPMMIKSILGKEFRTVSETVYYRVEECVNKFIDETTGMQTIKQMLGLVNLIKEFGFIPKNEILDKFGYKAIYNKELLKIVKTRIKKLEIGELDTDDFVIKGVPSFLKYMSEKNIKLYLASGTDELDVIKEAEALGYADLFEGRIFGSVGDINKGAKKLVMRRIIEDIGRENGKNVIAVGDGPIEIKEMKKCGGYAIGLASDEIRRFGLNISKRSRLIKAGADIIIPDYSQRWELYRLFNI